MRRELLNPDSDVIIHERAELIFVLKDPIDAIEAKRHLKAIDLHHLTPVNIYEFFANCPTF